MSSASIHKKKFLYNTWTPLIIFLAPPLCVESEFYTPCHVYGIIWVITWWKNKSNFFKKEMKRKKWVEPMKKFKKANHFLLHFFYNKRKETRWAPLQIAMEATKLGHGPCWSSINHVQISMFLRNWCWPFFIFSPCYSFVLFTWWCGIII